MSTVILFVDGDNIDESYTEKIFQTARKFGDIYEAHCFGDFVKKKQSWQVAYAEYKTQLHYIPGSERKKGGPDPNTSDIALTVLAMEKLYELPDADVFIIAANDKDYIPLAKAVREKFHKKAVMLYTQQNDKAISSYEEAVLLRKDESVEQECDPIEEELSEYYQPQYALKVLIRVEARLKENDSVFLSWLGNYLRDKDGIDYGESLGEYLQKLFGKYPMLGENYSLILEPKRARIERKV